MGPRPHDNQPIWALKIPSLPLIVTSSSLEASEELFSTSPFKHLLLPASSETNLLPPTASGGFQDSGGEITGLNMEAPRSVDGRRIQRKPLGDCTNIVSRSSQQSSSSVKYANPSVTFSLKRLVDQTTLKEKPKDVHASEAPSGSDSLSLATNVWPETRRMSTDLGSPASAPHPSQSSLSDLGVGDKMFAEPWSVYTVRKKRKKDLSSSSAEPRLRRDLTLSSGKKRRQPDENKTKPSKVAPKKRQRTVKQEKKDPVHGACQDELEKQKAYFAEIDAFELPVEEVSGSDLD